MTFRLAMAFLALIVPAAATVSISSRRVAAREGDADPALPARLSEASLYRGGHDGSIDPRNRVFSPQYPLWTDGAAKRRWVDLPSGAAIDASDPHEWQFPIGTRLWKEFSFDGRRVETRLLWRFSRERWVTASYVWNEEQTDAVLAPEEGAPNVVEVAPGRWHSIPSAADCLACHASQGRVRPLGFDALQLSPDRDPLAIHGEPLAPGMVTLRTLAEEGVLVPRRTEWEEAPPRIRASDPTTRAVLGYLASNCGSCHNGNGEIAALGPVLKRRDLLADGDAVARGLIGHATKWQVPGVPEGGSVLADPASPETSAIVARMRSRAPSSQMPPLGTVVRDQEAVDAIVHWIPTLPSHEGPPRR